jgi:hypothetical protein
MIIILIKRFKLRIYFNKNNDISNQIVVSDDYTFNPNILNHSDSLIKIAIITDNCDNWLNSNKLGTYDYIFSLTTYHDDLNEYSNVSTIKGETVYEQIQYILNELYRRKSGKFNSFINYINFQNVFPKWNNYFKILNSKYFDDKWYRNTYHIKDNTDSVIHFLLIGDEKGYDPGPDFSVNEYYECNFDVMRKDINPLLHYEIYGKKENLLIRRSDILKRNYSTIANSPYFDEKWYKRAYDLDDDVDCVDHYLTIGYTKGYNPGPKFNTYEYWECNLDIKEWKMNPLLHYELYGKKEKRDIQFSEEIYQKHYSSILNSPYFDSEWYKSTYELNDDVDCVDHYLTIGYTKGYNPGPKFNTHEYYQCNDDVKVYGMNPLLHYELYGKNENRMIWISEMIKRDHSAILNSPYFDEEWYKRAYGLYDDVDCVDHYLTIGYTKGYNPGPKFSANEYWECNLDIKEWKMNPLLHYELYGRKENRQIHLPK